MFNPAEYLDNEWFVVRHSGELPEVALHSSLHFLTQADDGPKLSLADYQLQELREAAKERYREIIIRDLLPENRDATIYRGLQRAIVNYRRLRKFCDRQGVEIPGGFTGEIAESLLMFLAAESADVLQGSRRSVINCSFPDLISFAVEVGLDPSALPEGVAHLCQRNQAEGCRG